MTLDWSTIYRGNLTWLPSRTILLTKHGSHAYGLNTPSSDLDVKGVAVPPREYFVGYLNRFEQAEGKDPDLAIYDIRKFFTLAADCNPNIIEVLFTDPSDHLQVMPAGELMLANRDAFLSTKAKHTFSGYAMSQMKRINTHYRYLKNPPKAFPDRTSFGLRAENEMTPEQRDSIGSAMAMVTKEVATWDDLSWTDLSEPDRVGLKNHLTDYMTRVAVTKDDLFVNTARSIGLDDNLIELLQREKRWRAAKAEWDSYQNWKATRNPQRAAIEEKYGYDCKHAMHLCRLLKMCREILSTGKVIVKRPDREELLSIRNGAWTYEQLVEFAEREDKELSELAKTSPLPKQPDRAMLDRLCIEIVERMSV